MGNWALRAMTPQLPFPERKMGFANKIITLWKMSNAESSGSLQGPSPCFSPVPFQFHLFPVVDLRSTLRPDSALKVSLSEILQLSRNIIRYWLFLAERESGLFSPARDPK